MKSSNIIFAAAAVAFAIGFFPTAGPAFNNDQPLKVKTAIFFPAGAGGPCDSAATAQRNLTVPAVLRLQRDHGAPGGGSSGWISAA